MDATPIVIECKVSQKDADLALNRLKDRLQATKFKSAKPADVPCLISVQLENGKTAYTDKKGEYFIIGIAFDLKTGQALDNGLGTEQVPVPKESVNTILDY